ncbi:MAG: hypothetical protein HYR76_00655 [Ignavibacteria bacterium]|nr:hypothetical protein [Ignavibacteria bacterium]MBI3765074.1 hypothetical protein [Ignavibacteriales bacterium]
MKIFTDFKYVVMSISLLAWTLTAPPARAQNPFEDAVKQISSDNARGYLQPFVNAVGANLNSGLYHSAQIGDVGLALRFDIIGMGTLIGDAEKTYNAIAPQPFDQTPVQTATVYGGIGTTVHGPVPGIDYHFQNGEVKTSIVLLAVPQLTIGNVFGTQAIVRYIPIPQIGDFPKVNLFGIGAHHNVSRYLPASPVDLAVGLFYQKINIGDTFDAKTVNFGAEVSKSFSVATLYGGMQYESATMNVTYVYTGPGSTPNTKFSFDMDSENKFRMTGGLSLNLVILNLSADINVGKVTVISGALGFGL